MRSSFQLVRSLASEASRALSSNKMRSALAALGITIGIAAVVCVVAIGRASSVRLEEQLQNLGDNLIWVEAGSRNVSGVRTGTHGMNNLTLDDAKAIVDEIRLIKSVSPHVDSHVSVVHENRNWTTTYRGVGPEYIDIKRWRIAEGNWFTQAEVDRVANVCVIGQTVREQLFGSTDPIGRVIRISNQLFEVIGLLAPKGQTGYGFDQDDVLLVPYTTAQKKLRGKRYHWGDAIIPSPRAAPTTQPCCQACFGWHLPAARNSSGGGVRFYCFLPAVEDYCGAETP